MRYWKACLILSNLLALLGVGCGQAPDNNLNSNLNNNVGIHHDGGSDRDGGLLPDSGHDLQVRGWRSEAFEHSAFIPEADVDEQALGECDPWLMAAEGEETWWVSGMAWGDLLPLFPNPEGVARIGLIDARGYLSAWGEYGHMGYYQREFEMVEWSVLTCPTVERMGHCVLPREADFCQFPIPEHTERETYLVRTLPGPMQVDSYQLMVIYNPNIDDGTTIFYATFALPVLIDPQDGDWEVYDVNELPQIEVLEEHQWLNYKQIPYPLDLDGWILRNQVTDALMISISARAGTEPDLTVHIWGHFAVNNIVAYE